MSSAWKHYMNYNNTLWEIDTHVCIQNDTKDSVVNEMYTSSLSTF